MIGQTIAHYKVTAKLGTGGMGEVYRATDTKLGRDVALKVLPAAFAADAQRMARFQREAQVLASLNHPHIAAIYGLEHQKQIQALAMELVEGATLAERIHAAPGRIPVPEALPMARQIAEALEYAHERGIVHRDLKPANIKLTPDGQVKVLDFGLAKALTEDSVAPDISTSPTMSIAATKAGMILGTAAYMSPEQAKGRAVDRRTDVWAFGCVLYEMLTGKHAFPGEDASETLAAIIRGEPNWAALPRGLPASIAKLLKRCLEKDAKRRLQAIGEARIAIEEHLANPAAAHAAAAEVAPSAAPSGANRAAWAVAALATLAAATLAYLHFGRVLEEPRVIRAFIPAPDKVAFNTTGRPDAGPVTISPDGRLLVFSAGSPGKYQLWIRSVDSLSAQPLADTEGGAFPFWSPDDRTIGFFAQGKLKKMDVTGGPAITLCDAAEGRGGTWNKDNVIVFSPQRNGILHRVSAAGGQSTPLSHLADRDFSGSLRWPSFLPDGRHFLFLARRGSSATEADGKSGIMVGSLDGGLPKRIRGPLSNAQYAAGHLLYVRDGTLMATPFDPARWEPKGDPFPIAEGIQTDLLFGRSVFSVSDNGVLAYLGGGLQGDSKLQWYDRAGKTMGVLGDAASYRDFSISPDGTRVVTNLAAGGLPDIWIYDVARGLRTRFSFDPAIDRNPVWSPDGRRVVYLSEQVQIKLLVKPATGAGTEEVLPAMKDRSFFPSSWSRDGRFLAGETRGDPQTAGDIWVLPLTGDSKPISFLKTAFVEVSPAFSPDGRWIAYVSNESGRDEVYVAPFPGAGGKWQVSATGGSRPRWRGDGKELFYLNTEMRITAVEVNGRGDSFTVGQSRALFETSPVFSETTYDVTRDGQRFLVNTLGEQHASHPITLVINWPAALPKK